MREKTKLHTNRYRALQATRRGVFLLGLAFAWLGATPSQTLGQDAPPALATELPSEEELKARIKEVEERADLSDTVRTRLLDLLRPALEARRIAQEWSKKLAELEKAREEAPQRLTEIKAELAQPAVEVKPDIPPDASLQQLEQLLAQHEADLKALQSEATSLEEERKRRTDRRSKVPQESTAAKQKLEELATLRPEEGAEDESAEVARARELLHAARKRSLELEIATYDREIQSYDARTELLTARRDLLSRRIAQKQTLVDAWRDVINERRRKEADRAAREAQRTARRQAILGRPVVKDLADANAKLANRRAEAGLADKIDQANKKIDAAEKLRARIADDERSIRGRVEKAGLTKAMGLLLRNRLETLPDVARYERDEQLRATELADVQVTIIELDDERNELANIEPLVAQAMQGLDSSVPEEERQEVAVTLRDLYETRRKLLDSLISDASTYRDALFQLDVKESELVSQITSIRRFIKERILWVPSTSLPALKDADHMVDAIRWFFNPARWGEVASTLGSAVSRYALYVLLALPVLLALLGSRFWLVPYIRSQGEVASRGGTASIAPTFKALAATVLLSLSWPIVLVVVASLLHASFEAPPFAGAVGTGLYITAMFLTVAALFRNVCRPRGLARAHFEFPEADLKTLRRNLFLLMLIALPLVFVVVVVERQGDEDVWATLGRALFIVIHIFLIVFAVRTHGAITDIVREATNAQTGGWIDRLRYVWKPLLIGLPILLILLALLGYYYTALRLAVLIQKTCWLTAGFLLLNAILLRWLLVARRKLAIEQYRKRRAAALAAAEQGTEKRETTVEPEPEVDLSAISLQTRTLVRSLVGFGLIGALWFVWIDVLPALNVLDRVTLWSTTQAVTETLTAPEGGMVTTVPVEKVVPITLASVLLAVVMLFVSYIALRNLPGLMEIAILQRLPLQQSSRYAITTITRYIITVVGLVIAFGAIGINWSKVQWLAAAITVGLGFGLQEIFANFVSGIIILFERPIRVGDIVTVGTTTGKVGRIQMRATTIIDWDNLELIVPNKDFITSQVKNWTLTDGVTRVRIDVGIAYGSDTELARDLLVKVASEHPLVMKDPAPWAIFNGFGDSALTFNLYAYLATRDHWRDVMHGLYTGIDQAFRQAGIEIAFPQRDLHIRTIEGALRMEPPQERPRLEQTVTKTER